jgi:hypothetical protein
MDDHSTATSSERLCDAANACLHAPARDERRAVLAAKVAADDGAAGVVSPQ